MSKILTDPEEITDYEAKLEPSVRRANRMLSGSVSEMADADHPTLELQGRLQVLRPNPGELVASALRGSVIDMVQLKDTVANSGIAGKLKKVLGMQARQPFLEAEIAALSEIVDRESFAMQATLADMHMAAGNKEEAEATYKAALEAAMRGGYPVIE